MKITAIEISHHRQTLSPAFKASWDGRTRTHADITIVRVCTDEGLEGYGSGDRMVGFDGHQDLFVGKDPMLVEEHFKVLQNIDFHYGRCWPLDLALWDLVGKIAKQPVYKLLGGKRKKLKAYASMGVLRELNKQTDQAVRLIKRGFHALKVRFRRGDWRDDIKALESIRSAVGDDVELMVDCNQGWRMPWDTEEPWKLKDALQVARELERLGVYWMEEPLHRADLYGMRQLREMTDIRIAGAEMTRSLDELSQLIRNDCLDVIQPDAALVGGITGLRRIAYLAEDAEIVFTPHTWTNGFGVVANAHLAAGASNAPFLEFPFDPPDWSLSARDFGMTEPFDIDKEGWVALSDAPGMGYQLDEAALSESRI